MGLLITENNKITMNLKNKVILVTGSSSGIGQAIAISCAKKGAIILINYRSNINKAKETLNEVNKYSQGYIFKADLMNEKQTNIMFSDIYSVVDDIDILVNNAGDSRPGDFLNNEQWKYQMESIFYSALRTSQYFIKQCKTKSLSKILNISSCYGDLKGGNIDYFSYSIAKAALSSMTVTLAKNDGRILVNAIAPGYTWTPVWNNISGKKKLAYESKTIINRYITTDEIAHTAIFILENDAITGQVITIDGGLSLKS